MTDIHNHLLFGVDDGSKTLEESVDVLRDMANYGFKNVILTPHYIKDSTYNNRANDNFKRLKLLKDALYQNNININLFLGNEIYIDDDIYELLLNKDAYTLNGSQFVLIELPMSGEYPGYEEIFKFLQSKGCKIILAHPERYLAFQRNYNYIYELAKMGVYFQGNLESILGRYGENANQMIRRLLKEKRLAFLATDIHAKKHDYKTWDKAKHEILKIISKEEYDILINVNPGRLVD